MLLSVDIVSPCARQRMQCVYYYTQRRQIWIHHLLICLWWHIIQLLAIINVDFNYSCSRCLFRSFYNTKLLKLFKINIKFYLKNQFTLNFLDFRSFLSIFWRICENLADHKHIKLDLLLSLSELREHMNARNLHLGEFRRLPRHLRCLEAKNKSSEKRIWKKIWKFTHHSTYHKNKHD